MLDPSSACIFVGLWSLTPEAQAAWVQAIGSLLAIGAAVWIGWRQTAFVEMQERREIDRTRRAIRINFNHAIIAMLDLSFSARTATTSEFLLPYVQRSREQFAAATKRLARFDVKFALLPPDVLDAYGDLENHLGLIDDELRDMQERLPSLPSILLNKSWPHKTMNRLCVFNDILKRIHPEQTGASEQIEYTPDSDDDFDDSSAND